eukprot:6852688-Alexandrium_andersonii.AAC.1
MDLLADLGPRPARGSSCGWQLSSLIASRFVSIIGAATPTSSVAPRTAAASSAASRTAAAPSPAPP